VHVLGERDQHSERILEAIPARDLRQQGLSEAQLRLLHPPRSPLDQADAAVEALEDRPMPLVLAGGQARGAQHRRHAGERHRAVLRREGVDRRRDDAHPCVVEALPGERLAREHVPSASPR
jgi:hypothetical protein